MDKNDVFVFSPLQGGYAKKKLDVNELEIIRTIIYQERNKTYSDAVIKILTSLGGL